MAPLEVEGSLLEEARIEPLEALLVEVGTEMQVPQEAAVCSWLAVESPQVSS